MTRAFDFHPEAQAELSAGVDWYDAREAAPTRVLARSTQPLMQPPCAASGVLPARRFPCPACSDRRVPGPQLRVVRRHPGRGLRRWATGGRMW